MSGLQQLVTHSPECTCEVTNGIIPGSNKCWNAYVTKHVVSLEHADLVYIGNVIQTLTLKRKIKNALSFSGIPVSRLERIYEILSE